ncbi:MAG: carbohydrate ABC transporter permease [Clostridia bacterium]|nr:carbohydrate ABC transporter permease [Clostridia bacterium]
MKRIKEFILGIKEKLFPSNGKKSFLAEMRTGNKIQREKMDWGTWKRRNLNLNGLGKLIWIILRFVIIVGISYMILYPFVVKFVVAFSSTEDIVDNTVMYIPRQGSTYFLERAMLNMNYWKSFMNTALLSLFVSVFQLFVASVAGYGFARFKFKGRDLLFVLVLLTLMIPAQTIQLPLYVRFSHFLGTDLNLINTFWPLVILSMFGLGLKNGLYIYLMRQFFRGLPKELENSAYIDGAGFFRTFISIMLPNAANMMITVFLFSFTWQWTDTTYNRMLMPKLEILANKAATVASSIKDEAQQMAINDTACLLIILPLLIVFLFAQRYFIQSIERSGLVE